MTVGENMAFPLTEFTAWIENTIRIISRMKLEVVTIVVSKIMPSQLSGMIKKNPLAKPSLWIEIIIIL